MVLLWALVSKHFGVRPRGANPRPGVLMGVRPPRRSRCWARSLHEVNEPSTIPSNASRKAPRWHGSASDENPQF